MHQGTFLKGSTTKKELQVNNIATAVPGTVRTSSTLLSRGRKRRDTFCLMDPHRQSCQPKHPCYPQRHLLICESRSGSLGPCNAANLFQSEDAGELSLATRAGCCRESIRTESVHRGLGTRLADGYSTI